MSKCLCAILFLGLALQTFAFGGVQDPCQDCPEIMVQRQCVSAEPDTTPASEGVGFQCDAEACGVPLVAVPDPQGECGRQVESSSVKLEQNVVNIVIESYDSLIEESEEDMQEAKDAHGLDAAHKLLALIDGEGDVKKGIEIMQEDNSLVAVITWMYEDTMLTMGGASLSVEKIDDDGSILVSGIATDNVQYKIACLSSEDQCILASKDTMFSTSRRLLGMMSSQPGFNNGCFPGYATVVLRTSMGSTEVSMHQVKVGDFVLVGGSRDQFEPVISVPHAENWNVATYKGITVSDGEGRTSTVEMTPEHLLFKYTHGQTSTEYVRAESVQPGDLLVLGNGTPATVVETHTKTAPGGLYTLVTPSRRLVVNGVECSAYADTFMHKHTIQALESVLKPVFYPVFGHHNAQAFLREITKWMYLFWDNHLITQTMVPSIDQYAARASGSGQSF